MKYKRIHIIGGAGSGKTALAREYSHKNDIPHFELDAIMWSETAFRKMRPEKERDNLLQRAIDSENWVMEGIFWLEWVNPSFERAEKIIVLDVPERIRHYRVVKRHIRLLAAADPSLYHTFFPTLIELIRLNHIYKRGPYKRTLKILSKFSDKVTICNNYREAALELCM